MIRHTVCREREREKTPILYKRDWSWDAVLVVTGLGAGVASSATSSTIIMSSTWASVVPAGKVPKDTTPTTSTASLPVLARRFLADPHEIGRFEGIGPDLWELGAASTRASVGREPVTAEDCGSDCGSRRLELGVSTYGVRFLFPFLMPGQGFEKTCLISEVVTVERLITSRLGFDADWPRPSTSYTARRSDVDQGKTAFTPLAGGRRRQRRTRSMVHRRESHPLSDRPEIAWPCRT